MTNEYVFRMTMGCLLIISSNIPQSSTVNNGDTKQIRKNRRKKILIYSRCHIPHSTCLDVSISSVCGHWPSAIKWPQIVSFCIFLCANIRQPAQVCSPMIYLFFHLMSCRVSNWILISFAYKMRRKRFFLVYCLLSVPTFYVDAIM